MRSQDGSGHLLGEPLLGVLRGNFLELAEFASSVLSSGHSLSSSGEDDVEVHAENTGVGVILDSQINVLVNSESEVTYKNKC